MVRSYSHDFGTYREVTIAFAGGHQGAADFACQVESGLPHAWDAIALRELVWLRMYEHTSVIITTSLDFAE